MSTKKINIAFFDSEFTATTAENRGIQELIQCAFIVHQIEMSSDSMLLSMTSTPLFEYSTYVKPTYNKTLSDYIKRLTGIKQKDVEEGKIFLDAINDLYDTKNELTKLKGLGNATASDISDGKTAVVQGELVTGTGSNLKYKTFYCSSRDTTFTLTSGFQPFITCNLAELQGKSVKASWLTIGYSYSSNSCPIYYSLTNSGTTYYINVHTDSTCTGRLYISSPAIAVIYEG